MRQGGPKNNEGGRENVIKAHAQLDAMAYIKLMKEKSPESLELNKQGEIILNSIEGEPIMEDTRRTLRLNNEEMETYLFFLVEEVEKILKSESNLSDVN